MNNHLRKKGYEPIEIEHCTLAFEDGIKLMNIVNALYQIPLPKYNKAPKLRPHKLDNLALAMHMVEQAQIKTNFLKSEHLLDHDQKMILGMLWAIILDYAIKGISVDELTAKEGLLLWCRKKTAGYRDVDPPGVQNFSTSWKSGMALCALIHRHRPDLIPYDSLDKKDDAKNLELAFSVAERDLGIPRLLDVEDLTATERPDERSVMTYISEFFHRFASQDIKENAARRVRKFMLFARGMEQQQHEYEHRARALLQWLQQATAEFQNPVESGSLDEAQAALQQFRHFVLSDKPSKTAEKLDVESLFAEIQTQLLVNDRRPYEPAGDVHPDAIEEAFDRLSQAERQHGQRLRANRFKFIRKEDSVLPQEKIDEFTASFKHFDKNGNNTLDKTEFKAALSALGVPFKDDTAFQKVFSEVSEGASHINLEQYIRYNKTIAEDKDNPEQIRQSFLLMSDQSNTISGQQLRTHPLTDADVQYLSEKMPAAGDNQYDYDSYIKQTFVH